MKQAGLLMGIYECAVPVCGVSWLSLVFAFNYLYSLSGMEAGIYFFF